ncbi:hypothetical protein DOTSEDRAFT_72087 [Dothistroma septosporum NZE10]|uniref:Uncharacterized protein n=1 Tax=Dothistroma septosporum (strain NZE10 / CBS 128990) TaxID=675120 RepID=N1PLW9_DOTSN|nr:hypothetical protein DOTSEDRAFT_72087 [Dothistroma septosporum NZE10]
MFDSQKPRPSKPVSPRNSRLEATTLLAGTLRMLAILLRSLCDSVNGSNKRDLRSKAFWWLECWNFLLSFTTISATGRRTSAKYLNPRSTGQHLCYWMSRSCFLILGELRPKKAPGTQPHRRRPALADIKRRTPIEDAAAEHCNEIQPSQPTGPTQVEVAVPVAHPGPPPGLNQGMGQVKGLNEVEGAPSSRGVFEPTRSVSGAFVGRGTSTWHQHHCCLRPLAVPKPAHIRRRSADDVLGMQDDNNIAEDSTDRRGSRHSYVQVGRRRGFKHSKPHRRCFSWPEKRPDGAGSSSGSYCRASL